MFSNGVLRFVESTDHFSVYQRADGSEVYFGNGFPRVELVEYDRDWMLEQWSAWHQDNRDRFLDLIRSRVLDPDVVDDIRFCENCDEPDEENNGQDVGRYGDSWACDTCIEDRYRQCEDCDVLTTDVSFVGDYDNAVCQRCLDNNYSFCDSCDEYYHYDDASEHRHDECDMDCESPAMSFTMPNNGESLHNDERVTIALPAGHVDDVGLAEIKRYLRRIEKYDAAALVDSIGREWQTSDGNMTKRLSRALYKHNGGKLDGDVLSRIGNIASDHSRAIDFRIEITRNLNLDAEDFYHSGSCWWGEYSEGRCALKTNGGFGLRTFSERGSVQGRAWVMPLRADERGQLVPTFDAEAADAYVVFNGYGDLEGYNPARIVAHMTGNTYTKIEFSCSPMFVNGGSAYLVGSEEIVRPYRDGSLVLRGIEAHADLYATEQSRELVDA